LTRFFDVLFSAIALIILLPFLLLTMAVLKLSGEHNVFYFQSRVGEGGKDFNVFKFVTMMKGSEELPGGLLTQKNDPRILPLGRFLRKTKINELPQLINIFIGQMSFVGPRPQVRLHYELYSPSVRAKLDAMRPGLTGIGSVVFRDEESLLDCVSGDRKAFHDSWIAPYKGELEVWYSEHKNICTYFLLIFLTLLAVIYPRSNAYKWVFRSLPRPQGKLGELL
jgi:lipopolysaccharide/colanic/teichoic acid biosynthesis glycosyltransferase